MSHAQRWTRAHALALALGPAACLTLFAGAASAQRIEGTVDYQVQFGPLALTRAQCPPGSLHDQTVKQWGNVRSYVLRDGHLFLSLMADGGVYEFEPVVGQSGSFRSAVRP